MNKLVVHVFPLFFFFACFTCLKISLTFSKLTIRFLILVTIFNFQEPSFFFNIFHNTLISFYGCFNIVHGTLLFFDLLILSEGSNHRSLSLLNYWFSWCHFYIFVCYSWSLFHAVRFSQLSIVLSYQFTYLGSSQRGHLVSLQKNPVCGPFFLSFCLLNVGKYLIAII